MSVTDLGIALEELLSRLGFATVDELRATAHDLAVLSAEVDEPGVRPLLEAVADVVVAQADVRTAEIDNSLRQVLEGGGGGDGSAP